MAVDHRDPGSAEGEVGPGGRPSAGGTAERGQSADKRRRDRDRRESVRAPARRNDRRPPSGDAPRDRRPAGRAALGDRRPASGNGLEDGRPRSPDHPLSARCSEYSSSFSAPNGGATFGNFSACYTHNYREFMGGFTDWVENVVAAAPPQRSERIEVEAEEPIVEWRLAVLAVGEVWALPAHFPGLRQPEPLQRPQQPRR